MLKLARKLPQTLFKGIGLILAELNLGRVCLTLISVLLPFFSLTAEAPWLLPDQLASSEGFEIVVKQSPNGAAVVVAIVEGNVGETKVVGFYNPTGEKGNWGDEVLLSDDGDVLSHKFLDAAIDGSGNVIVAWVLFDDGTREEVQGNFYKSGAWAGVQTIALRIRIFDEFNGTRAAMNDAGIGYVIFESEAQLRPEFFQVNASRIDMSAATPVFGSNEVVYEASPGDRYFPVIDVFPLGGSSEAIAVWIDSSEELLSSVRSVGAAGTWGPDLRVDLLGDVQREYRAFQVGVISGSDALAVWVDFGDEFVLSNTFSGGTWSGTATEISPFSPNTLDFPPPLTLATRPNGFAASGFIYNELIMPSVSTAYVNVYSNGSWNGTGTALESDPLSMVDVAVNDNGQALAGWFNFDNERMNSSFYDSGVWGPVVQVATNPVVSFEAFDFFPLGVAMSNMPTQHVSGWFGQTGPTDFQVLAAVTKIDIPETGPLPPVNFRGEKNIPNRFLTQNTWMNRLRWDPSPTAGVVSYRLYRDGKLIATIKSTDPLKYVDHDRNKKKTYTYSIESVDGEGKKSTPIVLIL